MQPSDKKVVDLPRLKEDILKYKPWLSETAAIWWDQLDLDSIYSEEVDRMEWILLDLQDGKYNYYKLISVTVSDNTSIMHIHVGRSLVDGAQTPPPHRDEDLAALFATETRPCKV